MSTHAEKISLGPIGQIAVNVHDVDAAVRFYRDTLGIAFLFQVPKMAFFDCAGVRLMLAVPEKPELDHPSSILYFKVGDIQATQARLSAAGVAFESQPQLVAKMKDHDLWMTFFRDVDRNLLALMSEVRRG